MAVITSIVGARTALTTTALDALASATYVSAGIINHATNDPLDVLIEVKATPGTVAGNKQIVVFVQGSLDGTAFESGPVSGTSAVDEANLTFVGTVPCNTNAAAQTGIFSLATAFQGTLPLASRIIIKNDTGAALAATGHSVHFSEVTGSSV